MATTMMRVRDEGDSRPMTTLIPRTATDVNAFSLSKEYRVQFWAHVQID